MTSVENSYFKLFMEDLISWKEELFNETNDDEEDVEHLGQTFGLGEGKSLSNCFSPILSLHSLYSTPRKIPNLTLNCKSLGEFNTPSSLRLLGVDLGESYYLRVAK